MTEVAAIEETVNAKMIGTLLVIYRIARRALSAEERVGHDGDRETCVRGIAEGGSRAA